MDDFEANVVEFLKHKEKKVLVIKGKWGIGKTFKWNEIANKNFSSLDFSNYSYVSLFGLDGLQELQSSVFYNARRIDTDNKSSVVKSNLKKVGKVAKNIPQVTKYVNAMSTIENSLVNKYLICIDDIERKSNKLLMSTLLGYISNLSELNDCKVILIFNDDMLPEDDRIAIDQYREKAIDLELEYSPNPIENIDIEFRDHRYSKLVFDIFKPEGLNNIRIIRYIKWNLDALSPLLNDSEEAVRCELLSTIAILTYVHHEPSINIRANEIKRVFKPSLKREDADIKLRSRISPLGYNYYEEYEDEIINYIENGWMDESKFCKNIRMLNERQLNKKISSRLKKIWGLYNDNFLSTREEIVVGFEEFLNEHLSSINVNELCHMLEILKEIESDFDEKIWIEKFIKINLKSDNPSLLRQLKRLAFNSKLTELISEQEKTISKDYSIYNVLKSITLHQGYAEEDLEYLGNLSVEEIYKFLVKDDNEDLLVVIRDTVKRFRYCEGNGLYGAFGRNLHQALNDLAKRTKLDRYRVTQFLGVELDEKCL